MLKITRLNANGQEVEAVIKEDDILGITEVKKPDTRLYDEDGNIVESKPNESIYMVFIGDFHNSILIDQNTYTKLIAKLKIESL